MPAPDTKILIPEIPGEWTERTRSGHTNIWNQMWPPGKPHRNGLPEIKLEPPELGLYAERIDGAWYWVTGCHKCLGITGKWSYITCHEHDRCVSCGTHRTELTDIPWGHPDGFRCKPCQDRIDLEAKTKALAAAAEREWSEDDTEYISEILCPHCASEQCSDEQSDTEEAECGTCGGTYSLEIRYEVSYTTRKVKPPSL